MFFVWVLLDKVGPFFLKKIFLGQSPEGGGIRSIPLLPLADLKRLFTFAVDVAGKAMF